MLGRVVVKAVTGLMLLPATSTDARREGKIYPGLVSKHLNLLGQRCRATCKASEGRIADQRGQSLRIGWGVPRRYRAAPSNDQTQRCRGTRSPIAAQVGKEHMDTLNNAIIGLRKSRAW